MLELPSTTLVAVATQFHEATARALVMTRTRVQYRNTVVFTDRGELFLSVIPDATIVPIKKFEVVQDRCVWSVTQAPTLLLDRPDLMGTHMMAIQWDGFVVNTDAWRDDWLDYDMIGAKWYFATNGHVGNTGFCLLSRQFLDGVRRLNLPPTHEACSPSDRIICDLMRPQMEEFGVKFAPVDVADRFSTEDRAYVDAFGFHGVIAMFSVMQQGKF